MTGILWSRWDGGWDEILCDVDNDLMLARSALQVAVDDDVWETMITLGAQTTTARNPHFRRFPELTRRLNGTVVARSRLEGMGFHP